MNSKSEDMTNGAVVAAAAATSAIKEIGPKVLVRPDDYFLFCARWTCPM